MVNKLVKIIIVLWTLGIGINNSFATIIVSGDGSFTNFIITSSAIFTDPGSQRFLENITQGDTNITIKGRLDAKHRPATLLDSYFSSKPMDMVNVVETVTATILQNTDMLLIPTPDYSFTGEELASISDYVNNGGSIFFMGEYNGYSAGNATINQALSYLGSSMRIIDGNFDQFKDTAVGKQIALDPYTNGVTTFTYYRVSEVEGGTPLFYTNSGAPFIEYTEYSAAIPEPPTPTLLLASFTALFCLLRRNSKGRT